MPEEFSEETGVALVEGSGLFWEEWYSSRYSDVAQTGVRPVEHYLRYGGLLGRSPSPLFDVPYYLSRNKDVADAGENPLYHFLTVGRAEGRAARCSDEFDSDAAAAFLGLPVPESCLNFDVRLSGHGLRFLSPPLGNPNALELAEARREAVPEFVGLDRLLVLGWDIDCLTRNNASAWDAIRKLVSRRGVSVSCIQPSPLVRQDALYNAVRSHDFVLVLGGATLCLCPAVACVLEKHAGGRSLILSAESDASREALARRFPDFEQKLARLNVSSEEQILAQIHQAWVGRSGAPTVRKQPDFQPCQVIAGRQFESSIRARFGTALFRAWGEVAASPEGMSDAQENSFVLLCAGAAPSRVNLERLAQTLRDHPECNAAVQDQQNADVGLIRVSAWSRLRRTNTLTSAKDALAAVLAFPGTVRADAFGMPDWRLVERRHSGEDIYVVAAGASAGLINPRFFDGKVVIGVNRVFGQFPVTYSVFKEYAGSTVESDAISEGRRAFVARWECGDIATGSEVENGRYFSKPGFYVFDHYSNQDGAIDLRPVEEVGARLCVSRSTITSAIHLAARMGARSIILVGHDCGTLDGKSTYDGYYGGEQVVHQSSDAGYLRWLGQIEAQTLSLKAELQLHSGVPIYSLNPFLNPGLEGHVYDRTK